MADIDAEQARRPAVLRWALMGLLGLALVAEESMDLRNTGGVGAGGRDRYSRVQTGVRPTKEPRSVRFGFGCSPARTKPALGTCGEPKEIEETSRHNHVWLTALSLPSKCRITGFDV